MNSQVEHTMNEISIPSESGDAELLFQIINLFPMPIEIFTPDGTSVYINRAFLEVFHISDPHMIVGNLNILTDPYINKVLGLEEYLKRVFDGEVLSVLDIKVPFDEMTTRYGNREDKSDIGSMYQNITCFPVYRKRNEIMHIVAIFNTTRIYQGHPGIVKAKEYIEAHWREEFDIEKVAHAVNLSRYHFARLFKKHTSVTPYDYYREIKIRKLKEALCDKNLSVSQAFETCSVDYNGYYARIFRDKVGMTPSQFRKSVIS